MDKNKIIAIAALAGIGLFLYLSKAPLVTKEEEIAQATAAPNSKSTEHKNLTTVKELQIKDTVVGTGPAAKNGDSVEVNYTGKLTDGYVFDTSLKPGRGPFSVNLGAGQVIKGWDKGLLGMKKGGKRTLTIPGDMAYGPGGQGDIPPNATLVFDIEMLSINKK